MKLAVGKLRHHHRIDAIHTYNYVNRSTLMPKIPSDPHSGTWLGTDSFGQHGNYIRRKSWGICSGVGEIWETLVKLTNVLVSRLMKEIQDTVVRNLWEKRTLQKKTPNSVQLAEK